ncbi:UDP-N-acetylglucosamine--N-acetylmuramyl-(pentapeptide) pyrophosphoryl-undecaprenol N-acetylglucosamine transferase [Candidatus Parcubacteria bacterium]|nr:MAG: UDP-N-acetylglucosamine--N-acetylmuramyl-(pentapeptide) pyrophosphoryl-undecaprenol N-acetylglucosamine transferase [Candidatus Parcubacteria bacterium]
MSEQALLRVLLAGGGSGGHIYPLIAVTQELRRLAVDKKMILEIYYLGPRGEYTEILHGEGIETLGLVSGKLRRYASILNILDAPKFLVGLVQAFAQVLWLMPNVIFSKGGTGALPVVLAGWFYRIPVIIHESDTAPGLTNLLSSRFASRVAVSFERTLHYFNPQKSACVGNPVRAKLLENPPEKGDAKEELGFDRNEPLLLILGGSQGSQRIDDFIVQNLPALISITQILHQTGQTKYAETERLARAALLDVPLKTEAAHRYQAVGFLEENLKRAFSAADVVVARAGSGTIFEIAAFAKPSILIPLSESANDHQRTNAYEFAKSGAAIVIEESNLLPGIFLNQVREVLKNRDSANKMSLAAGKFFKPGAAEIIAREMLRIAGAA